MESISRRRALQLGGLGLAGTLGGGYGLIRQATLGFDPATGATLVEPVIQTSTGGALQVRLEDAEGPVRVAGRTATTLGYNGARAWADAAPNPGIGSGCNLSTG